MTIIRLLEGMFSVLLGFVHFVCGRNGGWVIIMKYLIFQVTILNNFQLQLQPNIPFADTSHIQPQSILNNMISQIIIKQAYPHIQQNWPNKTSYALITAYIQLIKYKKQGNIMPTEQELQLIFSKLINYKQRKRPALSVQQLPATNIEDCVAYVQSELQRQSLLFDQLILDAGAVAHLLAQWFKQANIKIQSLTRQLQSKISKVEQLKQSNNSLEQTIQTLQTHTKLLHQQLQSTRTSLQCLQIHSQTQQKEISSKLLEEETNSSKKLQEVQQFRHKNQQLINQIRQLINDKASLEFEKVQTAGCLKMYQEQVEKLTNKLVAEQRGKETVESRVKQLEYKVKQLQAQLIEVQEQLKNVSYGDFNMSMFCPPMDQDQQQNFHTQQTSYKLKLSQDVQHHQLQHKLQIQMTSIQNIPQHQDPHKKPLIPNNHVHLQQQTTTIQKTCSISPSKSLSKYKKPPTLDPYYCHYILLSQTIKILSNQQQFFNVDMKPFYKQIVIQKIPMFQWREWIYAKLQDIVFRDGQAREAGEAGEIQGK